MAGALHVSPYRALSTLEDLRSRRCAQDCFESEKGALRGIPLLAERSLRSQISRQVSEVKLGQYQRRVHQGQAGSP